MSLSIKKGRSIAVVSGKGGSGKTLFAAVLAQILCETGQPVVLMDGDTGTAGLSYYRGANRVGAPGSGFAAWVEAGAEKGNAPRASSVLRYLQEEPKGMPSGCRLLPMGNHEKLVSEVPAGTITAKLGEAVGALRDHLDDWLVVDCRGGIDDESLAICAQVDDIILLVEPDTTAYQAARHVVDTLSGRGLGDKLVGFVVNRVFQDPSTVESEGGKFYAIRPLGSIPFDLHAARAFLVGDLPADGTLFALHARAAVAECYPDQVEVPGGRLLRGSDYNELAMTTGYSTAGGTFLGFVIGVVAIGLIFRYTEDSFGVWEYAASTAAIAWLGIIAGVEAGRRLIGQVLAGVVRMIPSPKRRRPATGGG